MNRSLGQDAATARVNPQQVRRAGLIDRKEGVEYRSHQNRAARVRRHHVFVIRRIGFEARPLAVLINFADCVAQTPALSGRMAKLHRQTAEN